MSEILVGAEPDTSEIVSVDSDRRGALRLPAGWVDASVRSVCSVVSVGIVINPSHYYVPEGHGVRAFRSGNVRENRIADDKWVFLSPAGHQKNNKSILKSGDVLV